MPASMGLSGSQWSLKVIVKFTIPFCQLSFRTNIPHKIGRETDRCIYSALFCLQDFLPRRAFKALNFLEIAPLQKR